MTRNAFAQGNARNILFLCLALTLLLSATGAAAQQLEFSSSLNPVGSGARATGMGGAFIGVADDATAASWNPAGLVQLEKPEFSVVFGNFGRKQSYETFSHPESATTNNMSDRSINYLSAVFDPVVVFGHTMVFSLNYQRLYEMGKDVSLLYNFEVADPTDSLPLNINFAQTGHLYTLSPAFALQITPSLSLGVTANLWKDYMGTNGWDRTTRVYGQGTIASGVPFTMDVVERETVEFEGMNAHIGMLWNATSTLTVGGVVKTSFEADLKKTMSTTDNSIFGGTPIPSGISTTELQTMKMPLSYGVGFQYRPVDELTLALDVYQTEWSRFQLRDAFGNETNPLSGAAITDGRLNDTRQVRAGAEYLFLGTAGTVALRAGVFSDPEPAVDRVERYRGFSLGTGYSTKQYSIDAAYQYRAGKDVSSDTPFIVDNKMDVTQHALMVSGIYYFK